MCHLIVLGAPAHGHTNPALPVLRELVERGERVTAFNDPLFRDDIERAGAAFRPYPGTSFGAKQLASAIRDGNLANMAPFVLGATESLLPYLLEELPRDKPDLLIFDSMAIWGKMAATLLRLPAVSSISHFVYEPAQLAGEGEHSLRTLRQILPMLPGALASRFRLNRRYKGAFPKARPTLPVRGDLNLLYTARELQPQTAIIDDSFRFVGASIDPRTRPAGDSLDLSGPGPLVYLSTGTIHTGQTGFYQRCFEAFHNFPARFLLAVGEQRVVDALAGAPSNFTIRPSVPQLDVLQKSDLFITHGGMNSISEALYYGVPLAVIPRQIEQLLNGRVVEGHGAALVLEQALLGRSPTAAELRHAVELLLSGTRYREASARLRQSLRAAGGYRRAADEIQTFLAERPPG